MSYYRTCPRCGAHLDPGEVCDCRENLRDRLKAEILTLTEEECSLVLRSWKIYKQHPELTMEECVERAAQVLAHQSGRAEQIAHPVSATIVSVEGEGSQV